ncbi:MAG: glycerol-3-phosphate dehydrogenase/oxidase, partial [Bdellovibrionales bacterium]|nr:glycerol-3-phosphate dehydrogenase/oxidase [Bdellovibrionales bacterium]
TGAGVARDAASRGMKVALVEANDFASGTSSRSSKLVHGGIRYLENFEFGLVFEALAERSLLFEMAPHLVHPLRFVIPIYKSSRVGFWKMAAGMWLYDLLALFETPQMHEALSVTETHKRLPELDESEMTGAFEYSDAYMDDDRLVIETLRDAQRMGVDSANYTEVISAQKKGDSVESLTVKDKVSGKEFKIKAKQVMTSVGPWTDIFGDHIFEDWKKRLRPTKGVHITFARERFPVSRAVVMAVEKRIIFVIPRHEMVIVGTTDTDFKDDPVNVTTQQEDVSYILQAIDKYFPDLGIKQDDIIACYSGVRPLVNDGSESEGKTSREHSIFDHGDNLSFVAGCKYTTYRKMSEDCVDFVLNMMDFNERMSF